VVLDQNMVIIHENNVKILGLHLDSKLNFNEHISKLCIKACKQLEVISKFSRVLGEFNKIFDGR